MGSQKIKQNLLRYQVLMPGGSRDSTKEGCMVVLSQIN